MAKYPKIVIDKAKNTPVDIVHAEQNYDFMHHTHKMSDIVNDIGSGGGTGEGGTGVDGKDGKSAYESWLSLGNTGTEQDFIDSLKSDNTIYDDTALIKRIVDLESRPQIHINPTQPENLKNGDIWIEG